jgi:hypothetical protein
MGFQGGDGRVGERRQDCPELIEALRGQGIVARDRWNGNVASGQRPNRHNRLVVITHRGTFR